MTSAFKMIQLQHKSICLSLTVLSIIISGCSRSEDQSASLSGTVTLEGEPVGAGSILLISDSGEGASAELQADGSFQLFCRPGEYQVSISPPPVPDPTAPPDPAKAAAAKIEIPSRYQDVSKSGERVTVTDGSNTYELRMTKKPK